MSGEHGMSVANDVRPLQHPDKFFIGGEWVEPSSSSTIDVIDSGPGLSAEDAAHLFERGYRGSHAEHTHGGGIGLSIVRRLCRLYGWQVRVVPGAERGVVATLRFDAEADAGEA